MTAIPGTAEDRPLIRLADPAALVAALPVLLGFRPRDSLVLAAFGGASGRRLGLVLRVDLPAKRDVDAVAEMAAANLLRGSPTRAAVLVIGGAGSGRARSVPRRAVAEAAVAALAAHGVDAPIVVWAARCQGGAQWRCYDPCGCSGLVPDPGATVAAAHAVAEGEVVFEDRAGLEALVVPVDEAVLGRREAMLVRMLEVADADRGTAVDAVAASALVDAAIAGAAQATSTLDDEIVVRLAQALALPAVRDAALLRCAGPDAAAAEQLWATLARETPDPEAATPAALLAVSALLRGKGALANVALDRAEQAWPGHRLATLLRDALDAGLGPPQIRAWLADSAEGASAGI